MPITMHWSNEYRIQCNSIMLQFGGALLLAIVLLAPGGALAERDADVQAAFLTKIAIFVTWPDGAFQDTESPIVTCALDAPDIARSLESVASEATANGRAFKIRRIERAKQANGCHMIVIGSGTRRMQRGLARQLRGKGRLTVATSRLFVEEGGVVGMEMYGGKVTFEVNNRNAKGAELAISSRLLRLASAVH